MLSFRCNIFVASRMISFAFRLTNESFMYPSVSKKDVVLTIWMQFPPSFLIRTSAFQMIRHPKEILEFSLNNFWGYL